MDFLAGLLFGVAAAIPVGPIGILAVSQRLRYGFGRGFSVALTASGMDVVYCLVAIEAATFVTRLILKYSEILKVAGSAALILVSLGLFRQSRVFDASVLTEDRVRKGAHPTFLAALLYFSSPTVLAGWVTVSGLAVAYGWVERRHPSAIFFSVACGFGSALWYFVLLRLILKSADRVKTPVFRKIFLVLGITLVAFAAVNLLTVFLPAAARLRIL